MTRTGILLLLLVLIVSLAGTAVYANQPNADLTVQILSPEGIKDLPGREEQVKVKVTNHSLHDLNEMLVYITMADLKKKMTVNLEDYGASKPVYLEKLATGESQIVQLPIRFVYTSKYYLYVTAVTKDNQVITSSRAIPVEILGNTKINKSWAMAVTIAEPLVLLMLVGGIFQYRRRRYQVK